MLKQINNYFTASKNQIIEKKIKEDIQFIINKSLNLLGKENINSILLGGGFGRGEGTAYIKDGGVIVVNDYDFIIVHNRNDILFKLKNKNKLIKLAESLAIKINIKQIDFHLTNEKELFDNKMNTIQHFELVNGHRVVYGECNLQSQSDIIPNIPLFDGTWLLRNRGLGLILAGIYFLGIKQNNNNINKQNLWIEINKAKLALGDAFLLSQNLYKKNLQERYQAFLDDQASMKKKFSHDYVEAIKLKINSIECPYEKSSEDLIKEWFIIVKIYFNYFLEFESIRCNKKYLNWMDYSNDQLYENYLFNPKLYYNFINSDHKNISQKYFGSQLKLNKLKSISHIGLLLSSIKSINQVDNTIFEVLKNDFKFINNFDANIASWITIAKFLLLTIHPEGEAKKVGLS